MEDILDAYYSFQLEFLPDEWVENVWKTHLTEDREIPVEYSENVEGKDYCCLMQELIVSIQNWLNISEENSSAITLNVSQTCEKSWIALSSSKLDYKALICFLSTFVKTKADEVSGPEKRKLACLAFRLYINLLTIPGAYSTNIFNPILFEKMLGVIDLFARLVKSAWNVEKSKKGKGKKNNVDNQSDEDKTEKTNSSTTFTESDKEEVLHEICLLLRDVSRWLTTFSLNDEPITLINIIKTLVELTRLEQEKNILENSNPQENITGFITFYSYNILEQLCSPRHGDTNDTVLIIMKRLTRHLLIDNADYKTSMKNYLATKGHTYSFIKKLLRTVGDGNAQGIKAAVQQLCIQMPGRAEFRVKIASDIVDLLNGFPSAIFEELVLWIVSLAHTTSVEGRLNGIELISKLLNVADNVVDEPEPNDSSDSEKSRESLDTEKGLVHKLLLATIIEKCRDKSTLVRYKSLAIFANIIMANQPHIKELVNDIFMSSDERSNGLEKEKSFDLINFLNQDVERLELPTDPLPSGTDVIKFIERLAFDKKVFVRKNALQVLLNVCILDQKWITTRRLKLFVYHCRDRSVMIRKVLSKYLTDLVIKYPNNVEVVESWVDGLIPLIADNETKSQEKVVEYISKVIIDNIVPYSETSTPSSKLPWHVLSEISRKNMRSTFRFACRSWSLQGIVKKTFFQILLSHIATENNIAVWFFIVNLTEFQDFPFSKEIYIYFIENVYSGSASDEYLNQLVSEALFLNWRKLGSNTKEELYSKLKFSIESFSVPISSISRRMDICFQFKKAETLKWCKSLIQLCEEYLRTNVSKKSAKSLNHEALCRYIHTLGDSAHYSPGVRSDIIDLLATLIDPDSRDVACFKKKPVSVRGKVSAVSIVALGKLCLQDLFLARKYVARLSMLLSKPSSVWEIIKINTMVALSDLCIRFTSVVEDHFGEMFVTLKDSSIEVRKNSLTLITQLMQEDYLKMNSPLFFYMLMMILDPSAEIRQIAESFIVNSIVKRTPGVLSQFYLQAIFFFNDYEGMEGCSKDKMTEQEKIVFSIAGVRHFEDRCKIYRFMLKNMEDDHRFKVSYQICTQIFDQYLDGGKLTFDIKGNAVLKDSIFSLGCQEIRLEHARKGPSVEDEERDLECQERDVVCGVVRKAFLSEIVKRNYIENLMPIIIELKRKLEEVKSPLRKDLMICLRDLMMDYRNEIDDILSADSELAAEVAFDLKSVTAEAEQPSENEEYANLNVNVEDIESHVRIMSEVVLDQRVRFSSNLFQPDQPPSTSGQDPQPSTSNQDPQPSTSKQDPLPSTSSQAAEGADDVSSPSASSATGPSTSSLPGINESASSEKDSIDAPSPSEELRKKRSQKTKPEKKTKKSSKSKKKH